MIPPGGGEVIGDSADRRVEILADGDAVNATWSRFGPGRDGADPHIHRRHTDIFYVLAGELTVRLGVEDELVVVSEGAVAQVPPLVVHGFRNGSDAELRYLNFHAPGAGFAGYLRRLRDGRAVTYDQEPPPADGLRPASEAVIGEPGLGVHVDIDAIRIAELRTAAGDVPPPRTGRECLYVLEGELALTLGDHALRARAGAWVELPAGAPHAISSREPARYLSVLTPLPG